MKAKGAHHHGPIVAGRTYLVTAATLNLHPSGLVNEYSRAA
jgi:hypothetical protein